MERHPESGVNEFFTNINGIPVHAHYSDRAVEDIFLPFLRSMTALQKRLGRRILVMLAAPPGAGKSTLLSYLEMLSSGRDDIGRIQAIGIDGFHRRQKYLLSHTVIRDGNEIPMVKIKGAPVTFDLEGLTRQIQKVASGKKCGWPVYDRMLHDPVEDAVTIDGNIIILEGNYLLLDEDGWRDLRQYADYTVLIRAEEELLRTRLIERRMKTGVAEEASREFVDDSDMANVRICLERSLPADLILQIDDNDDYFKYIDGVIAKNGSLCDRRSSPALPVRA